MPQIRKETTFTINAGKREVELEGLYGRKLRTHKELTKKLNEVDSEEEPEEEEEYNNEEYISYMKIETMDFENVAECHRLRLEKELREHKRRETLKDGRVNS